MYNVISELQFVETANCFLHLSPNIYCKLGSSLSRCVRGVVVKSKNTVYLSVSSEMCRKLPDGFVGLSPLCAAALNLSPGDKLVLTPLDSAPSLSKVVTSPFSDDDRFILEMATLEVEASLLNQLRVVCPKQCFPIWISPSVTVKLIVDEIYPEVDFGRLEENTELIIGDVKKASDRIIKSNSFESAETKKESTTSFDECSGSGRLSPEPLVKNCVFRLVPQQDDGPPFQVNLSPFGCPKWLINNDVGTVYQLLACSEPFSKVYVNVNIKESSVSDIGQFKSLIISNSIFHHLSLSSGSKVLLSHAPVPSAELAGLLLTPSVQLKKKLPLNEIETIFRNKLSGICLKWGKCLLNSKGLFVLDDGSYVTVTLRPLDLEWAYVTLISLYSLPISVNTLETHSIEVSPADDLSKLTYTSSSRLFKSLQCDMNALIENTLRLKAGVTERKTIPNNFLFIGKSGSGKTYLSNCLLKAISEFPLYVHVEKIDCTSLKGKRIENIGKIFTSHLSSCKLNQPSVMLIENIEIICGTFSQELEKAEASFHIQRVSQKVADLLEIYTEESSIVVYATCSSISSVNSALFKRRGKSVFSTVLTISPLTLEERKELMEKTILLRTLNSEESLKELNIDYYSKLTDSYVAADLIRFIEKAIFEAHQRNNFQNSDFILTKNDIDKAFESTSLFIQNKLKLQKHYNIKLSDIGGLQDIKDKLTQIILWPSKYSALLNQCPLKKQTGVLLYGAPGSGKTILARAIANESSLNFITVKGPELMSKYIGESEEGVRRVFENAQAAKPSLLFFDEFESLAPRRGEEQTGVTDRVVNQLLTALDGVEPISGVIVVAASSRPDLIDPALLRSGRLSHHLFCSYPNMEDRLDILTKLTNSVTLADGIDLKSIAQVTEGFSGADLKGLLTTAQIHVMDRLDDSDLHLNQVESEFSKAIKVLTQEDISKALRQTQPSLSEKDKAFFTSIYSMFSKGKVPDLTKQRTIFA